MAGTVWTGYGRPAYGALRSALAELKRDDPLTPVTVLVPSDTAGVFVRRALAHGFGGRQGVAALSVLTLDRLAERLAGPVLAGSGRRPTTEAVLAAAWRRALAGDPGVFAAVAEHPATVRALARAYRELREVDDAGLAAIEAFGPVQRDLVRLHRRVENLLHADWYDQTDLRRAAAIRPNEEQTVHFLPQDVPPSGQLIESTIRIAGMDEDGSAGTVLHASDADDEVRCMVRRVTAALRETPAHRIAILYGTARPYARLLAEHLQAAGIRWNGRAVRPTIEHSLGRILPRLLATHATGWQRADVMAVLADSNRPSTKWGRISRNAGVVRGDDWSTRLKAYPGRDPVAVDALREFVTGLQDRLREGESLETWPALAEWARSLYSTLVGDRDDSRTAAAVLRTVEGLPGLATVEPAADLGLLALTLDLALSADLPRHGKVGDGVLVAPMSAAIGLDADEVFVLGLAEDLVPGRTGASADALLSDEVRELTGGQLPTRRDRIERCRRHVWAAFAAAPRVTASYPRGDLRRSQDRRPSRWLRGRELVESPSFAASLAETAELASDQEWTIRAAVAGTLGGDHPLDLGVAMRRARDSVVLTRFDGDLSGLALPDPAGGGIVSPTSLELWARCPHSYFVQKLLHVYPVETPEEQVRIDPATLGTLYHETLDQFFADQQAAGAVPGGATPWSRAQRAALRAVAIARADDLSVRGQTGHRLLWRRELTVLLARLDQYLDADQLIRAATGRRQVRSELRFGFEDSAPPVRVDLPDGRAVLFRGSADRVDVTPDGLAVIDYKSGSSRGFAGLGVDDPTLGGTKLQLPVYALAARAELGRPDADVSAEYWFLHKDPGRVIALPLTAAVAADFRQVLTVIADGMAAGLYPHRPPADDGWAGFVGCDYCDPDALGSGEHRERWDRKRTDPRLADYVTLVEGAQP